MGIIFFFVGTICSDIKNPVPAELFRCRNLKNYYYQNVVTVLMILLALITEELLTTTEDDIYITVWNLYFIRPLQSDSDRSDPKI